MTWESTILQYLTALRQAGKSQTTCGFYSSNPFYQQSTTELGKYGENLRRFSQWMEERGAAGPEAATRELIVQWGASLTNNLSNATARLAVYVVKGYYGWLLRERLVNGNPAEVLIAPVAKRRIQRALTQAEVQKLLITECACCPYEARGVALVSLMLDTGLRSSEVCRLEIDDLHFNENLPGLVNPLNFLIVITKGGHERIRYFSDHTVERVQNWLEVRTKVAGPEVKAVFVSIGGDTKGHPLTRNGLRLVCGALARKAGIKHFSPHAVRRTFAVLMTEAGAPSRTVQVLGDWKSLEMVERYTQTYRAATQFTQYSPVNFIENATR
jgi:integrase/recombinase XerD